MERLFVYGTLREPHVQRLVIGRETPGTPDVLEGYRKDEIVFLSRSYPMIAPQAGASVEGLVIEVTADDLPRLDRYETTAYERIWVTLRSGIEAWTYCKPPGK